MLTDHRRALRFSVGLFACLVFMLVAVGRHPEAAAPRTTVAFIGEFDASVQRWADDIRTGPVTALFEFLSLIGGGLVTIPLRIAVAGWLAFRRRFVAFSAFVLTWVASEVLLTWLKVFFHRGRPPGPLVDTVGFSFPSGHAVAGAALATAIVLVFFPPGRRRRKWELLAVAFTFVMALSRVYLSAHWFSDVLTGVLLGTSIALG
ncbi:MAG TPA: phosphatase PAP2 family protein, partial [Actinomycetota bacterium]|nr:phosphatase PAP2 family protein [Actinomycetota bacterium]